MAKFNLDYTLLAEQAESLGEILDELNRKGSVSQSKQERKWSEHLLGVWNMLHKLLDDREQ